MRLPSAPGPQLIIITDLKESSLGGSVRDRSAVSLDTGYRITPSHGEIPTET